MFRTRLVWLYDETLSCEHHIYRNDIQKQCSLVKRWLNHHFKQELSRMRPFTPNVNVNLTWECISGRGLSRPRGGHLSLIHITWTNCAISSFNTNLRIQPRDWTKRKWLSYKTSSCKTIMRIETMSYETFHKTLWTHSQSIGGCVEGDTLLPYPCQYFSPVYQASPHKLHCHSYFLRQRKQFGHFCLCMAIINDHS